MSDQRASLGKLWRTARHLRPKQIGHRLRLRAMRHWHATPIYGRSLGGRAIEPALVAPERWHGDPQAGRAIADGTIRLLDIEHPIAPPVDWAPRDASALWRFTLHYFEWLSDLRAAGEAEAARALVADWLTRYHHPEPRLAWHPYPMSLRLYSWLRHWDFLLDGADPAFREVFLKSIDRQARHLPGVIELDVGGNHLIKNLKAWIACSIALKGHAHHFGHAMHMLEETLAEQILPDGGHFERSPSYHLQVLTDLIDLADLLSSTDRAVVPHWFDELLERMTRALCVMRHPDGGLALFNDGTTADPAVFDRLGELPAPPSALPETGYYRLRAGETVVIADAGPVCPDVLPAHAHADTLSFEMSVGRQRLVVNGGTYAYQDPVWRPYFRATRAHSTVEVDGRNSAEVYGAFRVGHRPRAVDGHVDKTAEMFFGRHDGYLETLGLLHERTMTLTEDGSALIGQDDIEKMTGDVFPHVIVARFHLHPDVAAEMDGDAVALRLPDGQTWTFTAEVGAVALEDSVWAPRFNVMHDTMQITVTTTLEATRAVLPWRLARRG